MNNSAHFSGEGNGQRDEMQQDVSSNERGIETMDDLKDYPGDAV